MHDIKSFVSRNMRMCICFCDSSVGCPTSMSNTCGIEVSIRLFCIHFTGKCAHSPHCFFDKYFFLTTQSHESCAIISSILQHSESINEFFTTICCSCIGKYSTHKRENKKVKLLLLLLYYFSCCLSNLLRYSICCFPKLVFRNFSPLKLHRNFSQSWSFRYSIL